MLRSKTGQNSGLGVQGPAFLKELKHHSNALLGHFELK